MRITGLPRTMGGSIVRGCSSCIVSSTSCIIAPSGR